MRELTELMPDPQRDDLFDDIGRSTPGGATSAGGLLDDDDDLFGELSTAGNTFGDRQGYGAQGMGGVGGAYGELDEYGALGYDEAGLAGNGSYGAADEYESLDPQEARDRAIALRQLDEMYDARREWEMEECQNYAFIAHHRIMSTAKNRYAMALRLARIMEDIELQDHYEGEPTYWLPSWVRSYYQLDEERAALNEAQQEYERSLEAAQKQAEEDDAYKAITEAMDVGLFTNPIQEGQAEGAAEEVDPLDEFMGEILPPSAAASLGAGLGISGMGDFTADILSVGPGAAGLGVDDEDVFDLDGGDIELDDQ